MKRTLALTAATAAMALFGPVAPASAANNTSYQHCGDTIHRQTEKGTMAGGGPKAGIPAPTNCDHFFQREGYIGK